MIADSGRRRWSESRFGKALLQRSSLLRLRVKPIDASCVNVVIFVVDDAVIFVLLFVDNRYYRLYNEDTEVILEQ